MKYAQVFPGQGSQFVGMGKDLFDQYEEAKKFFRKQIKFLILKLLKSCLREINKNLLKQILPNLLYSFTQL